MRRSLVGVLALITVVSLLGPSAWAVDPLPAFDEIAMRLSQTNPDLKTLIVDQVADIRFLAIFFFQLRATVYALRPATYKVVIHDPPAFLRSLGSTFADISSPEKVLADYRARSIAAGASDGVLALELVGTRSSVNPPAISALIDRHRWLILETILRYEWGEVRAGYDYGEIEGFLLPTAIRAAIPSYFLQAKLTYTNYRLNVPLPEDVVASEP